MERAYQDAMAFKEMKMQAEKEEEEDFRREMMAKFAEDDRIDQMNAQRRRMKQLEHKREVEKLIEDRRRQKEADKVQPIVESNEINNLMIVENDINHHHV